MFCIFAFAKSHKGSRIYNKLLAYKRIVACISFIMEMKKL